jgi:hypothetical protein
VARHEVAGPPALSGDIARPLGVLSPSSTLLRGVI